MKPYDQGHSDFEEMLALLREIVAEALHDGVEMAAIAAALSVTLAQYACSVGLDEELFTERVCMDIKKVFELNSLKPKEMLQ